MSTREIRKSPAIRRSLAAAMPLLFGAGLALAAGAADAQDRNKLELTPFGTYLFGGEFDVFDRDLGRVPLELGDNIMPGVMFDIPINRFLQVEILAARQSTDLQLDSGLLGSPVKLTDIDIDYLQGGILWQANLGQAKPFVVAGVGIARLNPDEPALDSETRPSFSLGGGVKTFFSPNFGMRFEGRLLVVPIDDQSRRDDFFCCRQESDSIAQGWIAVGLIFAF